MHRLDEVVDTLLVLQKKHRIRFDVWLVVKRDHAIISFFDQGMNPAVPRVAYWTPFRYPLLLNLASLFDNELAEKAWRARLEAHDGRSSSLFSEVCSELLARVHTLGDRRYIELITDALSWAMTHFDELGYNCKTGKQKLQIMPNMVGFQFVLRGICSRLGAPNRKADIVVDQQSQFNTTQRELREFYYQIREMPWVHGPGLPVMDVTNMPAEPLVFQSGTKSAGLELVDIYLWIFKRFMEGKELTRPPYPPGLHQSQYRQDGQCLRSKEFLDKLQEPTAEMMKKAREYRDQEEARRLEHRVQILPPS
ncbi:TPA: hypothetical protein ROA13_004624 [Escherichia coli]|nr:hypothetical protein [Escherichia coli]EKT9715703.1 hypothetical protein [Escherichia coli]HDV4715401.1 hypothetical protein [Escherichia coli]HDX2861379.1 hypothetical protein [Escherichia coli]HEA2171017.1 hypothetical protein [Escherichia coli]